MGRRHKDLTGRVFGLWSVTGPADPPKNDDNSYAWSCTCVCGGVRRLTTGQLGNKNTRKGCISCTHKYTPGDTVGQWRIVALSGSDRHKNIQWLCKCTVCENETTISSARLAFRLCACRKRRSRIVTPTDTGTNGCLRITNSELKSPIVYVYETPEACLYVGMSTFGLSRPFHGSHKAATDAISAGADIVIYYCSTVEDAKQLEADLIKGMHPLFNSQGV